MKAYAFRPLRGLATLLRPLLVLEAATAAALAVLAWLSGPETNAQSIAYTLLASAQFLLFLAAGIVFLVWVYRSTANAHSFGAQNLASGPGLAVAWYFIPIANLWMPLATMRETWKASVEPRDWEMATSPAVLPLWWLTSLAANIAALVGFRLGLEDITDAQSLAHIFYITSDALTAPASLFLAVIVGSISRMQDDRAYT